MATILEFRTQVRSSAAAGRSASTCSAEVVLFPGVRYERWGEAPPPPPAPRRGRRRDSLEIED